MGQEWGYLKEIDDSWMQTWRTGSFNMSLLITCYPRAISWKFCDHIFIRSVSRLGVPLWWYFEDIEGSWLEAWMTGSSLMQLMTLFDPKDPILKVSGCYFNVLWSYKWFWSKWPTSETREGQERERWQRRVKLTLTLPGNVRQGWGKGSAIYNPSW